MATYYVATDGNDGAAGDLAHPWLTLSKAVSGSSSGDTVYFRSGTWENERLDIQSKEYTSLTTFARYPSDAEGSVVFDGTNLTPQEYEDGVIYVKETNYVKLSGLKVQNFSKSGICFVTSQNSQILYNITEYTGQAGIIIYYGTDCNIQYNKIYYSNLHTLGDGMDEILSIATSSTNIDVSHNELYAGDRNLGWTGGEGLNVKDGCSYVYIHHNYVDMARPDQQDSDRYSMGVDAWQHETHHIYFYKNIIKNGGWGLIFDSEYGGYCHHIYGWNNIIINCGNTSNHGSGIALPHWGTEGNIQYCYWWNNTIYGCYYGARFLHLDTTAPILVQNNIFSNSISDDVKYEDGVDQEQFTLDHNLASTDDPDFDDAGNEDFHIGEDSDALDNGVTIPEIDDDYDGIGRPQGDAFDIGAYERSQQPPKTQMEPGTTLILQPGVTYKIE